MANKNLPASLENFFLYLFLFFLILFTLFYGGTSKIGFSLILELPLILSLIYLFKKPVIFKDGFLYWLFFLASLVVSTIFTISPSRSFEALILNFSYFLYFFLSLNLINKKNLKFLIAGLILNALILSFASLYYLLPLVKKPETVMNLVYALSGHSHLADLLILVLPITLVLYFEKKKFPFLLIFLFLLTSFLLTFSRASFLVLPFTLFFLFYQLKKFNFLRFNPRFFLFFLIPIFWLLGIFLTSLLYPIPLGRQPKNWLERQVIKRVDTKRLEYFRQALVVFKNHAITGSGPATFYLGSLRFQKFPVSWSTFTHNHCLQVLSETGILGFLAFLLLLSWLLKTNLQIIKKEKNPFLIALFAGILGSCLHSFLDFDWQFPAIFIWFLVLNGAILSFSKKPNPQDKLLLPFSSVALILFILGLIFLFWGNPIKADPQNPYIYQEKAEENLKNADYEKARKNFALAIEFNPLDDPGLYRKLADLSVTPKEKISILKKYYNLTSSYTWREFGFKTKDIGRLYYELAKTLYEEKNYETAEKIMIKTLTEVDNWELDDYALLKKIFTAQGKNESYSFYSAMCETQLPKEPRCF